MSEVRHEVFDPKELEAKDAEEIPKAVSLLTREQVHSYWQRVKTALPPFRRYRIR